MLLCNYLNPDNSGGPFKDFKRTGKLSLSLQLRKNTKDVIYMIYLTVIYMIQYSVI
jgi:hypothetical protein